MNIMACAVDGCETPKKARGWCTKHYKRWRNHGDPVELPTRRLPPQNQPRHFGCAIEGCAETHEAKGYCKDHYMQRRYREDKTRISAVKHGYREANRERLRQEARAYYAANADRANQYSREAYRRNIEARTEYRRTYQVENRDKVRAANNRRYARQMGVEINDLTADQWIEIKEQWGQRCAYCGTHPHPLTMDHYQPISKGGNHTASNIVPACLSCNARKNDGPPLPFYYELAN